MPLYNELVCYARKLANNDVQRAADVVQDSLLKAFKAWKRFECPEGVEPAKAVRGWLYIIVANTFMKDYYRGKVRRRAADERRGEVEAAIYGDRAEPIEVAIKSVRDSVDSPVGDEVMLALSHLSNDHRAVIEAYYIHDLGCEQIAAKLGIPKNTVFTRLDRARKALAPLLSNYAASVGLSALRVELAKPAKRVEPDADAVDGVVALDDDRDLVVAEPAAYQSAAW